MAPFARILAPADARGLASYNARFTYMHATADAFDMCKSMCMLRARVVCYMRMCTKPLTSFADGARASGATAVNAFLIGHVRRRSDA